MNLVELKNEIVNNTLSDELLVLVCAGEKDKATKTIHYGAHYLADMYLKDIAKNKCLEIQRVDCLADAVPSTMDLLMGDSSYIRVLRTSTLNDPFQQYDQLDNTVVICDKIDKKIISKISPYVVYISEPLEWTIEAYADVYCTGISQSMLEWLYSATNGNVYRMMNELDKVKLFDEKQRNNVLIALKDDPSSDLYSNTVFALIDALFNHDIATIKAIRTHIDSIDLDPVGLTTLLLRKYRGILLAACTNLSAAELGMTDKQLGYFKGRFSGIASNQQLLNLYEKKINFLSNIDLKLKQCKLDMSTPVFVDYIISNMLA